MKVSAKVNLWLFSEKYSKRPSEAGLGGATIRMKANMAKEEAYAL
jgi:hypothetical protein